MGAENGRSSPWHITLEKLAKFYGNILDEDAIIDLVHFLAGVEHKVEPTWKKTVRTMIDAHFDARGEVSEEDKIRFNNRLADALSQTEKREDEDGEYLCVIAWLVPSFFRGSNDPLTLAALASQGIFSKLLNIGLDEYVDLEDIDLINDEAYTNAVKYGHEGDVDKVIKHEVRIYSDKLVFSIEDQGKGFDLEKIPDPTKLKLEERIGGGHGVYLMCALADGFEVDGGKVTMTFFKKKHSTTMGNIYVTHPTTLSEINKAFEFNKNHAEQILQIPEEDFEHLFRGYRKGQLIARDSEGEIIGTSFSIRINCDGISSIPTSMDELLKDFEAEGNTIVLLPSVVHPDWLREVSLLLAEEKRKFAEATGVENIFTYTPFIYDKSSRLKLTTYAKEYVPAVKFHINNGAKLGTIFCSENEKSYFAIMVYKSPITDELTQAQLAMSKWQLVKARGILSDLHPLIREFPKDGLLLEEYNRTDLVLAAMKNNLQELFFIIAKSQQPCLSKDEIDKLGNAFLKEKLPVERVPGVSLEEIVRQKIEQFLKESAPVSGNLPNNSERGNRSAI